MSEHQLDARRLLCPMPVIKVQDKIKHLQAGDILNVICSDPGAMSDVPSWCRINGHEVLLAEVRDDEVHIQIKVENSGS